MNLIICYFYKILLNYICRCKQIFCIVISSKYAFKYYIVTCCQLSIGQIAKETITHFTKAHVCAYAYEEGNRPDSKCKWTMSKLKSLRMV